MNARIIGNCFCNIYWNPHIRIVLHISPSIWLTCIVFAAPNTLQLDVVCIRD